MSTNLTVESQGSSAGIHQRASSSVPLAGDRVGDIAQSAIHRRDWSNINVGSNSGRNQQDVEKLISEIDNLMERSILTREPFSLDVLSSDSTTDRYEVAHRAKEEVVANLDDLASKAKKKAVAKTVFGVITGIGVVTGIVRVGHAGYRVLKPYKVSKINSDLKNLRTQIFRSQDLYVSKSEEIKDEFNKILSKKLNELKNDDDDLKIIDEELKNLSSKKSNELSDEENRDLDALKSNLFNKKKDIIISLKRNARHMTFHEMVSNIGTQKKFSNLAKQRKLYKHRYEELVQDKEKLKAELSTSLRKRKLFTLFEKNLTFEGAYRNYLQSKYFKQFKIIIEDGSESLRPSITTDKLESLEKAEVNNENIQYAETIISKVKNKDGNLRLYPVSLQNAELKQRIQRFEKLIT